MSETSSEPTVTKTSYEATTVAQSGRAHLRHLLFQAGPLLALILLMAYLSFATSNFLTVDNLSNIARQSAFVAIVAVGQTSSSSPAASTFRWRRSRPFRHRSPPCC
jgi:ribose transport system permease protein